MGYTKMMLYRKVGVKGFTLIELMVAVSIIAIISIVGIAIYTNATKNSKNSKAVADINAIAKAYETHYDPVQGKYTALSDSWFATGLRPTLTDGTDYYKDQNNTGFKVCAALNGTYQASCKNNGDNSGNCTCLESAQGRYSASSPGPSSSPASSPSPSPPAAPTCSFSISSQTTQVGVSVSITTTTGGGPLGASPYFWSTTSSPPTGDPGSYNPSAFAGPNLTWLANTPGSYVLTLQVSGPGGATTCDNSSSPIVVSAAPSPSPSPSPPPTIAFRDKANGTVGTGTSVSVAKPATVADNDIMVANLFIFGSTATTVTGVPAGWAQIRRDTGTNLVSYLYWKKASSEVGPYAWTLSASVTGGVYIVAYKNVVTLPSVPYDSNFSAQTGTSVTSAGITTTANNEMLLFFSVAATANPTGIPSDNLGTLNQTNAGNIEYADQLVPTSGTVTGNVTATNTTSSNNLGQVFGLKP